MGRPFTEDHTHDDDFDPADVNWVPITRLDSEYEEEIAANVRGLLRHRKIGALGSWTKGPAPDEKTPRNREAGGAS